MIFQGLVLLMIVNVLYLFLNVLNMESTLNDINVILIQNDFAYSKRVILYF